MKIKNLTFILSALALYPSISFSQIDNMDAIYKEIVKADNEDYLPLFVKNRQEPNFFDLIDDVETPNMPDSKNNKIANIEDKATANEEKSQEKELKWQAVILAVQQNKVTPFELEIINNRIENQDPQATEILAFMNAKGLGIEQNLIDSFLLYQKAYNLGVTNAKDSAVLVYQSMSHNQKEKLKSITQ